jgi:PAS domain S-box-containing protein
VQRYIDGSSREQVLAAALKNDIWRGEVIHPHREGHELWIDASVRVLRDAEGAILGMVGINRDITERVRRDQNQREAEARAAELLHRQLGRLQVLADTSRAFATAYRNSDEVLEVIVERVAAVIGDSCSVHLLSADGEQLIPTRCHHFDPAARALMQSVFDTAPTRLGEGLGGLVVRTGQPRLINNVTRELFLLALRDEYLDYYDRYPVHSMLVVPLRIQQKVFGMLAVARDLSPEPYTEEDLTLLQDLADRTTLALDNNRLHAAEAAATERLSQALALLDTLFETAPIGLGFVDLQLRFVRVNAKLAEINGPSAEEHVGRHVREILHDLTDELTPIYRQVLDTGEAVTDVEVRGAVGDPAVPRTWLLSYYPVRIGGGQPIGVGVVVVEITALKRSADELRSLSRRLVEVQEAERRHLARELHDEVGQTLTGLDIMLEMLARSLPDQTIDTLETARRYVRDMSQLVRRLSLDLRPSMLDDLGLLPSLRWLYARFSGQTGVEVRFHHHGAERRFAPVVETAAYRIIQEALTNVARYARVKVVDVQLIGDEQSLQLQIEDGGAGFDPAEVASRQASSGLAGMRERATLIGGQITVESAPGRGTLILVELPLEPGPDTPSDREPQ